MDEAFRNHHWHQQSDTQQQWSLRHLAIRNTTWWPYSSPNSAKQRLSALESCLKRYTGEAEGRRMNNILYWTIQSSPSGEQRRLTHQGWRERTIMEEYVRKQLHTTWAQQPPWAGTSHHHSGRDSIKDHKYVKLESEECLAALTD